MKQALHFGLSHQLKMTPQLQQAIRLLQLSTLELQQEIQETLYTNPLLELDEETSSDAPEEDKTAAETEAAPVEVVATESQDIEYQSVSRSGASTSDEFIESNDDADETLQDYLLWQLNLTTLSDEDRVIGEAIIDAIDADGFLSVSMDDIFETVSDVIPAETGLEAQEDIPPRAEADDADTELDEGQITIEDCLAVLHRIQKFDPPGVAATDLTECLRIQLEIVEGDTEHLDLARHIVDEYLPLVSDGDLNTLVRRTRKTEDDVLGALALLRTLNPRPGSGHNPEKSDYIIPDLVLIKRKGQWEVSLNPECYPRLRLAEQYSNVLKAGPSDDKDYVREKLQEARWFLRSLESRHDTLLKVATSIVETQLGFFEEGPEAMKPLILKDLAERLGYHESTISRATNQKYLYTPRGVFELKYFFSSQVATAAGGEASSTAIKAIIGKLVDDENPQKPLSDSKLTSLLQDRGILVARRTVAKYREMLNIRASSARKRIS